MKIAVPVTNNVISTHFGHSEVFFFYTVNRNTSSVEAVEQHTPPPHQPGVLPQWLADNGTQVILSCGMGQRAKSIFDQHGIEVIIGSPVKSPDQLIEDYLSGQLESGENLCDH